MAIDSTHFEPVEELSREDLIKWAAEEIRNLDELCRSMIPGYSSFDQHEIERLEALEGMEFLDKEAIIEEFQDEIG